MTYRTGMAQDQIVASLLPINLAGNRTCVCLCLVCFLFLFFSLSLQRTEMARN